MAKNMDLLKDSHIFRSFWTEAAGSLRKPEEEDEGEGERERQILELQDAYGYLYLPCFDKFSNLYENLKLGEVTFAEVDSIFKVFENKYDSLTADLQVMCALDSRHPKHWIELRVEQIREYHLLHQAVRAAEVILEVKENLGLIGDFHVLHTLLRFVSHSQGTPGVGPGFRLRRPGNHGLSSFYKLEEGSCSFLQEFVFSLKPEFAQGLVFTSVYKRIAALWLVSVFLAQHEGEELRKWP